MRHQPILTPDQRRELSGVALAGAGFVLAVVLLLPGGGSIAKPVHDGLLAVLGTGAWLVAAGLGVTGGRLLHRHEWRGGLLAGIGSAATVIAVLGFLGLVAPGSAGWVGNKLGPGVADRLGGPASGVLMLVAASLGLVLAIDLRVAPVVSWLRLHLAASADSPSATRTAGKDKAEKDKAEKDKENQKAKATSAGEVNLRGSAAPVFVPPVAAVMAVEPFPELPDGDAFPTPADPELANVEPLAEDGFAREFEGHVEATLGPIPEVALGHTEAVVEDEAEKVWVLPTPDLLDTVAGKRERLNAEVERNKQTIVSTLRSFGIETRIIGESVGPTVTQYELQPAAGVPVRKIVGYQTDLSLALAAPIRIQPFIPGKSAIGIEVPNKAAQLVALKEIVNSTAFTDTRTRLAVALGADVSGHPVAGDLTRMPHLLIAGATGSGKSVCINAVLGGFLLQATPAELKLILIDPKRVELSNFADLPHLLVPVVVEPEAAVASLRWAVKEMEERYKLFASHGARNIAAFNERAPGLGLSPLPYTVIVIDELADLMMVAAGEIEDLICRIAQLARAVGIHLVVATQRPSADIITGLIKANIPSRVAFAVSSGTDSRVILDEMGAEKLLGRGDMLYLPIDQGKAQRLQGAFVSDRELDALINHWKLQGKPDYQEEIFQVEANVSWAREAGKRDPLFGKAAHIVAAEGRAAASLLQRKMNVGYTRAARLVDQLAEHRIVGPYEGSKSREVLMDVIQVDEYLAELGEQ
ncbi:MAG: DNA translocase FtsK [Candidatus Dormibacteraeota bacterium]|uniref:DNA translocase FtsK n=1 Tax=Candidatus Amunia macphersoniae TaxID=3127014 RepID=A0A934NFA8_9BACT|nr:DNA translocase FtsK [Candidatus Dormibacteraeota bacterium]